MRGSGGQRLVGSLREDAGGRLGAGRVRAVGGAVRPAATDASEQHGDERDLLRVEPGRAGEFPAGDDGDHSGEEGLRRGRLQAERQLPRGPHRGPSARQALFGGRSRRERGGEYERVGAEQRDVRAFRVEQSRGAVEGWARREVETQ